MMHTHANCYQLLPTVVGNSEGQYWATAKAAPVQATGNHRAPERTNWRVKNIVWLFGFSLDSLEVLRL